MGTAVNATGLRSFIHEIGVFFWGTWIIQDISYSLGTIRNLKDKLDI